MAGPSQLGQKFVSPISKANDIDHNRGIQQQIHFLARGFLGLRRLSLSRRSWRTHRAALAEGSDGSLSRPDGASCSKKRSSLVRRTASRAVSTRKALRRLGPTIESISLTRSCGRRTWARLLFICALLVCL